MPDAAQKHPPRLLSKADAAAYCGLTEAGFDQWVSSGKLPRAMKGTRRWDKIALDQAIDRLSGVSRDTPPKPSGLAAFIEKRNARKAAEAAQQPGVGRSTSPRKRPARD